VVKVRANGFRVTRQALNKLAKNLPPSRVER